MSRILIAGESWITLSTHVKGVDEFSMHSYTEGVGQLRAALESGGHEVVHLPAHRVPREFPAATEALDAYDVVVLSDIGANSLALSPDTFERSVPLPDRLQVLSEWVADGGNLLMIGGYLSFSGYQARANFPNTVIAEVLPVTMLPGDDRVERPAGVVAQVTEAAHPITAATGAEWPALLGYNRTVAKEDATVLVEIEGAPLVALGGYGAGRSAVFTSDCSPHWAPLAFCEEWPGYAALFNGLVDWFQA